MNEEENTNKSPSREKGKKEEEKHSDYNPYSSQGDKDMGLASFDVDDINLQAPESPYDTESHSIEENKKVDTIEAGAEEGGTGEEGEEGTDVEKEDSTEEEEEDGEGSGPVNYVRQEYSPYSETEKKPASIEEVLEWTSKDEEEAKAIEAFSVEEPVREKLEWSSGTEEDETDEEKEDSAEEEEDGEESSHNDDEGGKEGGEEEKDAIEEDELDVPASAPVSYGGAADESPYGEAMAANPYGEAIEKAEEAKVEAREEEEKEKAPKKELTDETFKVEEEGEDIAEWGISDIVRIIGYIMIIPLAILAGFLPSLLGGSTFIISLAVFLGALVITSLGIFVSRFDRQERHRRNGMMAGTAGIVVIIALYLLTLTGIPFITLALSGIVDYLQVIGLAMVIIGFSTLRKVDHRELWPFGMILASFPLILNVQAGEGALSIKDLVILCAGVSALTSSFANYAHEKIVVLGHERKKREIEGLFERAVRFQESNDLEDALATLDRLTDISPYHALAWEQKGLTLMNMHRTGEAIAMFDKAIEFNAHYSGAWNNKGMAYLKSGDYDNALISFEKAINIFPGDYEAVFNLSVAYRHTGKLISAIMNGKRLLDLHPDRGKVLHHLGNCYSTQRNHEKAIEYLKEAKELDPTNNDITMELANAYQENKELNVARDMLQEIIRRDPKSDRAWESLGDIYARVRKYKKAVTFYEKAADLNKDNVSNLNTLQKVYYSFEDIEKSLWAIDLIIDHEVRNVLGYKGKAAVYREGMMDHSKTADMFKEAIEKGVMAENTLEVTADEYYLQGHFKEAFPYYEKALEIESESDFMWSKRNKCEEALEKEKMEKGDQPIDYAEEWTHRARAMRMLERYTEASSFIKRALTINRNYYEAWNEMGTIYRKMDMPEKAKRCNSKAVKIKLESAKMRKAVKAGAELRGDEQTVRTRPGRDLPGI